MFRYTQNIRVKTARSILEPFHKPQHAVALKTIVVPFAQYVYCSRRWCYFYSLNVVYGFAQGARPNRTLLFQTWVCQLLVPKEFVSQYFMLDLFNILRIVHKVLIIRKHCVSCILLISTHQHNIIYSTIPIIILYRRQIE